MKRAIFSGLSVMFLAANVMAADSDLDTVSDPCADGANLESAGEKTTAKDIDLKDLSK